MSNKVSVNLPNFVNKVKFMAMAAFNYMKSLEEIKIVLKNPKE